MNTEGPPLDALLHRLAECPAEFLCPPRVGGAGVIQVDAVVSDLLGLIGGKPLDDAAARRLTHPPKPPGANGPALALVACWLLADPWFAGRHTLAGAARRLLTGRLNDLAALVPAANLVGDPDRREELVRRCLKELGLRPWGETEAVAADRLTALDSAERRRVAQAAAKAEARARAVREALAREAAKAAAASYTGE